MEIETINCISKALVAFMFLALIAVYAERLVSNRGIGARTIQITGVLLVIPLIGLLALQKVLEPQTTATLIGALTGYLLSGVGSFEPTKKENKSKRQDVGNDT